MVQEENLSPEKTERLIEDYLFAEWEPLHDEVLELIEGEKPGLLQRKQTGNRILRRIIDFVETFMNGMDLGWGACYPKKWKLKYYWGLMLLCLLNKAGNTLRKL
jgi:hypothetical protein